jgi:hypothetical protein
LFAREDYLASPVVLLLLSQDVSFGRKGANGFAARAAKSSRPAKKIGVCRKQLKVHFARQIRAKSSQILSAAAPVSFIFCHSSPHACIRARDAGGKFRGCGGESP